MESERKMKKVLRLFGIIGAVILVMVGCTSPIDDYVSDVETTKIEAKLDAMDNIVTELADLAESFNEDTVITDEENINIDEIAAMYDKVKAKAEELNNFVIDIKASNDTINISNEEVSMIHEELVLAVEEYETLANTVIESTQLLKEIERLTEDANNANDELLMLLVSAKPSKNFQAANEALMEQYAEEIEFVLFGELSNMLETRDIDYEKVSSINQSLKEAATLITMAQVTNDVDQQYKETISSYIDTIVVITNIIVEEKELIIETAEYTMTDLINEKSNSAKIKVEKWREKLAQ